MGYHYRSRYEMVLFFEKGKRKLNDLSIPDIITFPRVHGGYPAEKPSDLARVFIEQSSRPGELVLDPFMGSGSTGVASLSAARDFLGSDVCAEAIEIAKSRLSQPGRPAALSELIVTAQAVARPTQRGLFVAEGP